MEFPLLFSFQMKLIMKKSLQELIIIAMALFTITTSNAQIPEGFTWQDIVSLDFGTGANLVTISAASAGIGGEAELRIDEADGDIIGRVFFHQTGSDDYFLNYTSDLNVTLSGTHQVYINYLDYEEPFLNKPLIIGEIALSLKNELAGGPEEDIHVYPPVPGLDPSPYYEISVQKISDLNSSDLSQATNWQTCFAWFTQCRDKSNNNESYYANYIGGWSHTYVNFELDPNTPIAIKVTRKGDTGDGAPFGDILEAAAHPIDRISDLQIIGGEVYITMNQPGLFAIDIDGQMDNRISPRATPTGWGDTAFPYNSRENGAHSISIFANPFIENKPDPNDADVLVIKAGEEFPSNIDQLSWNTLYFEPGVHKMSVTDIEGILVERRWEPEDQITVQDNKNYYVPGDAIIYGNFTDFNSANTQSSNIKIFGHGTISGEKILHYKAYPEFPPDEGYPNSQWHRAIYISGAKNCTYEGLTVSDPANHALTLNASGEMHDPNYIKWMKVIGWRANTDATASSGNTNIEDCFFRAQDDGNYIAYNRFLRRSIFWHDVNGQSFRGDFMTSAINAGAQANVPKEVAFEDLDVIYARGVFQTDPSNGGFGLIGTKNGLANATLTGGVENTGQMIVFKDIKISDPFPTRHLFSFAPENKVGDYAGIQFINIDYKAKQVFTSSQTPEWRNWIVGKESSKFRNLVFENVTIDGETVDLDYMKNPAHFKTDYTADFTFRSHRNIGIDENTLTTTATNGHIEIDENVGTANQVQLKAIPEEGYFFTGWSGDLTGSNDTQLLTMDQARTVVANFKNITYTISTTETNGNFAFEPPYDSFLPGTEVIVSAIGDVGFEFESWSGDASGTSNPIVITMDENKEISALFNTVPTFELTRIAENGEIILDPPGPVYNAGTVVDVFASPNFEYAFDAWSGSLTGNSNPSSITIDANKTLEASFNFIGGGIPSLSINCGGGTYTAMDGTVFSADKDFNGGTGNATNLAISGTNDDELYQSERWGNMEYNIDLPNGAYYITFKFAETFLSDINQRVFSVMMEEEEIISYLDIVAEEGKAAAYDETHHVIIRDGQLNIDFIDIKQNPTISAIQIEVDCSYVRNANDAGFGSLREAISCVEEEGRVTLGFSLEKDTILLTSNQLILDKNLTIESEQEDVYLKNNTSENAIEVAPGKEVNLSNFTIITSAFVNRGMLYCKNMKFMDFNGATMHMTNTKDGNAKVPAEVFQKNR